MGKEPIEEKLGFLSKLYNEARANKTPPRIEERICQTVEELQNDLMKSNDYFNKLKKRPGSTAQKALLVINLIGDGTLIGSGSLKSARKCAHHFITKADFLESYLADADTARSKKAHLLDLERRLKSAGLA